MRKLLIGLGATIVLAGCGGSGDQTSAAATCLKNALANQALQQGGNNCNGPSAANVEDTTLGKITSTCTHKTGNEYVCDVTTPNPAGVKSGFYDVTYDGKSIVFQPTS